MPYEHHLVDCSNNFLAEFAMFWDLSERMSLNSWCERSYYRRKRVMNAAARVVTNLRSFA